jgi:hypothetical protein
MGMNDTPITVIFTNPISAGGGGGSGSSGTSGTSAEDVSSYAALLDTSHTPLLYAAEAQPGAAQGDPVWRIWRVDISTGSVKKWANGSATFANKWTERLILSYS